MKVEVISNARDFESAIKQAEGVLSNAVIRLDIQRAINESFSATNTAARRQLLSQYAKLTDKTLRGGSTLASVAVKMAGKQDLSASIRVTGRRLSLGRYGKTSVRKFGKQSRPPVFEVKAGRPTSIAGTFAVSNKSLSGAQGKGYQIVTRTGVKSRPSKGIYAGKVYKRGPKKGQPYTREKLEFLRNIAIPEMFNTRKLDNTVYSTLLAKFSEKLIARLESSFRSQLKRNARAFTD